jgi:hydroxylaminobenzene mutase
VIKSFQRILVFNGGALFTVGLFTGLWVAMTATGKVIVAIPHLALASHLNALLGGLWLLGVAFSLDYSQYSDSSLKKLCFFIIVASWANWFVTLVASILGVRGLSYSGDLSNDVIAFFLQVAVVVPSLLGGIYWVYGLWLPNKKGA